MVRARRRVVAAGVPRERSLRSARELPCSFIAAKEHIVRLQLNCGLAVSILLRRSIRSCLRIWIAGSDIGPLLVGPSSQFKCGTTGSDGERRKGIDPGNRSGERISWPEKKLSIRGPILEEAEVTADVVWLKWSMDSWYSNYMDILK